QWHGPSNSWIALATTSEQHAVEPHTHRRIWRISKNVILPDSNAKTFAPNTLAARWAWALEATAVARIPLTLLAMQHVRPGSRQKMTTPLHAPAVTISAARRAKPQSADSHSASVRPVETCIS